MKLNFAALKIWERAALDAQRWQRWEVERLQAEASTTERDAALRTARMWLANFEKLENDIQSYV